MAGPAIAIRKRCQREWFMNSRGSSERSIHGILAAHLDVAAQRDRVDAVVRLAPAEANQPLAEADGELLHPHPEPLGHRKVAELVNQNHEAQNGNHGDE